jgi:site-specific DNA recombinase
MKSAYLYVRVSTDEQKRKGYSLPEQEDRLLKYCENHDIKVEDIYREDFSAKNFNRPEWKKLIAAIKKKRSEGPKTILFIKWDRFSRNIEYAYEMIGLLRNYNTTAMAIDQPIDFSIPESTVMLAMYLSIPEAENSRRALNTANGIRRARQLGRYPHKAPLGFINVTGLDGKKYITIKQPEAGIIKWAFQQLAMNCYKINEVRRMACDKGLNCCRSHFVRLIRNPTYCGLIVTTTSDSVEKQSVKAIHTPLISETLFDEVQDIINKKKKLSSKKDEINSMFFLKGYLTCPLCSRKLCGSFSSGATKRYPYYHCSSHCKLRVRADVINADYINKLQKVKLLNKVGELFKYILEDINISIHKANCLQERQLISRELEEYEGVLSKARKLFVADKLQFDDFSQLKTEHQTVCGTLKRELDTVNLKLQRIDRQFKLDDRSFKNVFRDFENLDTADKKHIVSLITPSLNIRTGDISLSINKAISKIISPSRTIQHIQE